VDRSSIEIGTGESGITLSSGIDESGISGPGLDVLGLGGDDHGESSVVAGATPPDSDREPIDRDESGTDDHDVIDFGIAAAAGIAGGAAASFDQDTGGAPALEVAGKPARKRGLGQSIGILLGGVLAIPITLAILIWGLKQDPLGIARQVPESLAFLVPAELRQPAARPAAGGPDLSSAASLADLPVADAVPADVPSEQPPAADLVAGGDPATAEPIADHAVEEHSREEPATDLTAVATEPAAVGEPVSDEAGAVGEGAALPAADVLAVPEPSPAPADLATLVTPAEPALPAIEPDPVAPPVVPQPEPLDLSGVDSAVANAMSSLEAVNALADRPGRDRNLALVEWYRQMARVAEELTQIEPVATDSGTPLAVASLYDAIASRPELLDELARLARNWLAYAKRSGDGVVLPATFVETRQVGPYWYSRVSLAEAGGRSRELAVISRAEPIAHAGELVLLTGLALDENMIWAADVRLSTPVEDGVGSEIEAGAIPVVPAEPDPFGVPVP
jgi:hypothetical protein